MKKILVTGSKGQLGNELQLIASVTKHTFLFTDVEELDITDEKAIEEFSDKNEIDLVINCAAYTAVDRAEEDEKIAYAINAVGAKNLCWLAQKADVPFIHVSTDYVFDGKNHKPYVESDATNPQSIYGKTKLEGEKIISNYSKSLIIRTSWLYSTFGNNFVKTIKSISARNSTISVVDDQIGTPTYARDLAAAIVNIANKIFANDKVNYGIYHYSNQGVCSWYDFAEAIVKITNTECYVKPIDSSAFPRPATRPYYSILNKQKIIKEFDIHIPHWRESLKDMLSK